MIGKMRSLAVLNNRWLPAILCVVLVALWFTRWEFQASKTYDNAVLKWHTDRWTGKTWLQVNSLELSGRAPATSLEGEDAREYRALETSRAKNLTQLWGCALALSLAWLGFALSGASPKPRSNP